MWDLCIHFIFLTRNIGFLDERMQRLSQSLLGIKIINLLIFIFLIKKEKLSYDTEIKYSVSEGYSIFTSCPLTLKEKSTALYHTLLFFYYACYFLKTNKAQGPQMNLSCQHYIPKQWRLLPDLENFMAICSHGTEVSVLSASFSLPIKEACLFELENSDSTHS